MKKLFLILGIFLQTILVSQVTPIPTGNTQWKLMGNAIGNNTNFIGTTDNRSLLFKTNNSIKAKLDSLGNYGIYGNGTGNTILSINSPTTIIGAIYYNEGGITNWAVYNNPSVADKPMVWFDGASGTNVMTLTKGNLGVINNTNTAVFSGTNLGTAAANFPALTLRGVTYSTSISVPNLNHATLPNTSAWFTNALNGFCLTDGTNKLMSIASTSASGTGFILRPITIGSTVAPSSTSYGNKLRIDCGDAFNHIDAGSYAGTGFNGLWLGGGTPDGTNYSILTSTALGTYINTPSDSTDIYFNFGNDGIYPLYLVGKRTSGAYGGFQYVGHPKTNQTASTNIPEVVFTPGTSQRNIGAITKNEAYRFSAQTISAKGNSTLTNAYNIWSPKTIAGSSLSVTNNWGFGTDGSAHITQSIVVGGAAITPSAALHVLGNGMMNKLIGNSSAPTVTAGSGLGTGAGTVISVTGNDMAGIIGVTTGTTALGTTAVLTYITFNSAYTTNAPIVVLTPYNKETAALTGGTQVFPSASTTTMALNTNTAALTANTTYSWSYHLIGR